MSFIFLLCASIISSFIVPIIISLFDGKGDFSLVFEKAHLIILINHLLSFPGLILYFILSLTLWKKGMRCLRFASVAALVALVNGILIALLASGLASSSHNKFFNFATLFILASFVVTGFFTGCLHYFFMSRWKKYKFAGKESAT